MSKEQSAAYFKAYYLKHRAKKLAYSKARYARSPEAKAAYDRKRLVELRRVDPLRIRKRALSQRYKITLEEYQRLEKVQEFRCAICLRTKESLGRDLCVDHEHSTGKIRGLLCHTCNLGLGYFQDNYLRLQLAIEYLAKA